MAEAEVARLAARQQGLVTIGQLRAAGFSRGAVSRRAAGGWLVRRHRGIYQVGVFAGPFGREMAALLACGDSAALGDLCAAGVWRMCDRDETRPVDVFGTRAKLDGVRTHRAVLAPDDITVRYGLRITTPARTLLDLASSMPAVELQALFEEAQIRKLVTPAQIRAGLQSGRRGAKRLRELVELELGYTRSEAERRLRALVKKAGLPAPRTNVRIAGLEVDAVWPDAKLVVEVDGYAYHGTREAFERDRRRDARLLVAGYRVLRITWRRLTREPEQVIALIATALRS